MKAREKELRQEGDIEGVQEMQGKRLQASGLMPQVASTVTLVSTNLFDKLHTTSQYLTGLEWLS